MIKVDDVTGEKQKNTIQTGLKFLVVYTNVNNWWPCNNAHNILRHSDG